MFGPQESELLKQIAADTATSGGSSGLPDGAATAAKQDIGNTSLSSIVAALTTCNTDAVVVTVAGSAIAAANPLPVASPGFASSATTTRPSGVDAYTALDVVGEDPAANLTFAGIGSIAGGHVFITGVSLRCDVAAVPSGMGAFRLHLYDAAPTAIADNEAFNLPSGDREKYLGSLEITAPVDLGDTIYGRADTLNFKTKLAAGSTTLYGILQTVGAYTPTASVVKTITLHGIQS